MALDNAALSWNANTELDLAGYIVYFSMTSGVWTSTQNLGLDTNTVLTAEAFNADGTWYFSLTAKDTSNNESGFVTPISKRIVRTPGKFRHVR